MVPSLIGSSDGAIGRKIPHLS